MAQWSSELIIFYLHNSHFRPHIGEGIKTTMAKCIYLHTK